MTSQRLLGLVIADFNPANLVAYLNNSGERPEVRVSAVPYGQVFQSLLDQDDAAWEQGRDFVVVWTQPESVSISFSRLMNFESVDSTELLKETDEYAAALKTLCRRTTAVLVPTWVTPSFDRGWGMLDLKPGQGLKHALMTMNLRLIERLADAGDIFLLDSQRWIASAGEAATNPKYWYMAKMPFGNTVLEKAAGEIKAALRGLGGKARKLVILDLDNVLWGGVLGDLGVSDIQLGGHDPFGEAYVDFQKSLKALTNRGVILGIVSKNEESTALDAIENHPEMILRVSDLAGWKINWEDKALNVIELTESLNLGLDTVVFIDDSPIERSRIKETLPDVLVPEWPDNPMLYVQTLRGMNCFDKPSVTEEDRERTRMYAVDRQRVGERNQIGSLDDWLDTLGIQVKVEAFSEVNLQRTAQLLNKTNQMNLSTRRLSESELASWCEQPGKRLWTLRVADKFGDLGLTGIISVEIRGNRARIVDFVLSCRVFGRKIEETMLAVAAGHARVQQIDEIFADYVPTERNRPCLRFWKQSGFEKTGSGKRFTWKARQPFPFPKQVKVSAEPDIMAEIGLSGL